RPAPPPPSKPAEPKPAAPPAPEPRPRLQAPVSEIHFPAFTFRTMDHRAAKVSLNGSELNETPCMWSVTEAPEFDPKIKVDAWPPEGARFAGSTQHRDHPDWTAEIYIAKSKDDDTVLYVESTIRGRTSRGGMRLRVEG